MDISHRFRKGRIAFALSVPFLLWLVPWLSVEFSGHGCDPGPPQPTWQCAILQFSLAIFWIPAGWLLGLVVDVSDRFNSFLVAHRSVDSVILVVILTAIACVVYVFWAAVAYSLLDCFRRIRRRISN
jgi:hypothetical protein